MNIYFVIMTRCLFWGFVTSMLLTGCRPTDKEAAATHETSGGTTVNGHTSLNAVDWSGKYTGTLPCADCEGIETVMFLIADNSYILQTKYLGKGNGKVRQTTGSFSWNDAGNTITLLHVTNAPNQYFVGENQIIQLDLSGNRITGELADKYVLHKE